VITGAAGWTLPKRAVCWAEGRQASGAGMGIARQLKVRSP